MSDLINYNVPDAYISGLQDKYSTVPSALTDDGYEACKAGHKEIRGIEIVVEKKRLELNSEARKHIKMVDSEARRIIDLLEPIRLPMTNAKKEVDNAKKIAAEKESKRKHDIQQRLDGIVFAIGKCLGGSVESIRATMATVEAIDTTTGFDEFEDKATVAKADALTQLDEMVALAVARDEKDREIADLKAQLTPATVAKELPPEPSLPEPQIQTTRAAHSNFGNYELLSSQLAEFCSMDQQQIDNLIKHTRRGDISLLSINY